MHSSDYLPEFTFGRVFTAWELAPVLALLTIAAVCLYAVGVNAMHSRGDRWPIGRSVAFGVGIAAFVLATQSGLAAYDTTLLSAHMVQHMILSMVVPLAVALSAPVTLALRTLPARPRRWLLAVLHSRVAKVLTFPPLTFLLYVISPWALYFSGWYAASLQSPFVHEAMHVHLVVVGSLFFWPLLGVDPVPGRVAYPFRMLLVLLTLPFHAFLGVTIMSQTELLGGDWYPSLHNGDMGAWLPDPADDQHLAGGLLWSSGDLVGLVLFGVLFVQWVRSSMKEGAREDRRLDLLEARERAAQQAENSPGSIPRVSLKVLVYSDDVNTRQQVILALGRRPHPDLPEVTYVEVATEPVVIQHMDAGGVDLAILDGEAVPAGGMGIAKQLKDEIYQCPPVLVLTGRPQDAWLATWSRAEAAVPHPIDPMQLAEAAVALLRSRVAGVPAARGD